MVVSVKRSSALFTSATVVACALAIARAERPRATGFLMRGRKIYRACLAPPNRGGLSSTHIHGTHVPVGGAVHSIKSGREQSQQGSPYSITSSARSHSGRLPNMNTTPAQLEAPRPTPPRYLV